MKKKLLCIVLAALMLASLMPMALAEGDLITQISTEAQLRAFAASVNAGDDYTGVTVTLNNDIMLTSEWTPIGTAANPFKGTFDGGSNTISGMQIIDETTSLQYIGLFGYSTGTIKNIEVRGSITPTDFIVPDSSYYRYVGSIVGYNTGTVDNCKSRVNIEVNSHYIGGIAGVSENAIITNCQNYGDITIGDDTVYYLGYEEYANIDYSNFQTSDCYIGGQAGGICSEASGTISNCGNFGELTALAPKQDFYDTKAKIYYGIFDKPVGTLGGICATFWGAGSSVVSSFNKASISGGFLAGGGLLGTDTASISVTNCYNTGDISYSANRIPQGGSSTYLAGLIGHVLNGGKVITVTDSYSTGNVSNLGNEAVAGIDDLYVLTTQTGSSTARATNVYGYSTIPAEGLTAALMGDAYKDDPNGINGGYPMLTWEKTDYDNIQNVTISTTPADASLHVYRDSALTDEILDYSRLNFGRYYYKAEKPGYETVIGSFNVVFKDISLNITLRQLCTVSFNLNPAEAAFVLKDVNGDIITPNADGSYSLLKNYYYTYTATAPGCNGATREFTATGDMVIEVALTPSGQSDSHTKIRPADMPFTITSGGVYDLMPGDFAGGTITISTTEPVTLIGSGVANENRSSDIMIECAVSGVNLTLQDLYILQESGTCKNMLNFQGAGNKLNIAGTVLLDKNTGATGYAMIHVPDSAELTISGGTLYMYKREQGAGIGGNGGANGGEGQTAETNGVINFKNATIFAKNSKQGALIGAGAQAGTQTPGPINIENSTLYLIAISRGAAIGGSAGSNGASSGSNVTVKNSQVTINVDYTGSAIGGGGYDSGNDSDGGTLIYESGSIRAFIDENAKGGWEVDEAGVNGNKAITASVKNASGEALYLLELDTAGISGDSFTVTEGDKTLYSGPRHQYAYVNEALEKNEQIDLTYTIDNWTALNDTNLYLYLTAGTHTLTVNGETYTARWNASTQTFTVTQGAASAVMLGDVDGSGEVDDIDVILIRRHIVSITTLTGDNLTAADVNGDGAVDDIDVILVRRFIVNIIQSF